MKTCQNISVNSLTYKQFDQYIKPALGALCFLTKYSDDYNYVIMDNFCEILKKYFIENNKKITAEIVKKY